MTKVSSQQWVEQTATQLVQAIRSGDVSAQEVVEAHIQRINEVNPRLNAVVYPLFDEARTAAKEADTQQASGKPLGPLHGVPMTIKDQFEVADTPATWGLPSRAGRIATSDGPLVQRLRKAGAILLGKTNVSQLLLYNAADNPLYGRTNNPWNPERTPGGSSGGEAAIIAASGSALGLGGDIGGSLRGPAHFCGIATLKPTSRRLTTMDNPGDFADAIQDIIIGQAGPMARSVADLALAMEVLVGDEQDQSDTSVPPVPWRSPDAVPLASLRVAMYIEDGLGMPFPAIRRATLAAAEMLRTQGMTVEDWTPPDLSSVPHLFLGLMSADGGASALRHLGRDERAPQIQDLARMVATPPFLRSLIATGLALMGQRDPARTIRSLRPLTADQYWQLTAQLFLFRQRFLEALNAGKYDAILCPPSAFPALPHNVQDFALSNGVYGSLYNLLGMPAGVVPVTKVLPEEEHLSASRPTKQSRTLAAIAAGSAGLPVGVQVIARHWREDVVLAVMAAIERSV